jgi:hypothetical protein
MKARSKFARIRVVAVVPLLAAIILLGLPRSTHDSSSGGAPALAAPQPIAGAAEATPAPIAAKDAASEAPAAPIAVAAPKDAGAADRILAPGPPAVAGMVIGIDPETGTIGMPTLEQQQELSNMERIRLEKSTADLVPVFHQDGSISVDLKGRFQEFATVRIDPSGKKTFRCVDGEENAERAITRPTLDSAEGAQAETSPAARPGEER